jgi:predicted PurR-regulated permease PerM
VVFLQNKARLRNRAVSIIVAMLLVLLVIGGVVWAIIPPMLEQIEKLGVLTKGYLDTQMPTGSLASQIHKWAQENESQMSEFFQSHDFRELLKEALPRVWVVMGQTASVLVGIVGSVITLMYMFFILLDWESLTKGFIRMLPKNSRPFGRKLLADVGAALNAYVRGQGLVALIMGVLFCIGFTIIDFPMAIGLGILIGILDLVPYLHAAALIPTVVLALMKSADTGQNFWVILAMALAVFLIVQVIIDMVVTPKVMGAAMGLNPAVLLLSLSVWGALLGFIGLIIALPATTVVIAYYKRYVTKDPQTD